VNTKYIYIYIVIVSIGITIMIMADELNNSKCIYNNDNSNGDNSNISDTMGKALKVPSVVTWVKLLPSRFLRGVRMGSVSAGKWG